MNRLILPLFLALALTVATIPVQADSGPNEEQTGRSVSCGQHDGTARLVGLAGGPQEAFNGVARQAARSQVVHVDPGTGYEVWTDDGTMATVTFFTDSNDRTHPEDPGTVPANADWGWVCVRERNVQYTVWVPDPLTPFHYQDGFPSP